MTLPNERRSAPRAWRITPKGQRAIGEPITIDLRPRVDDIHVLLDAASDVIAGAEQRAVLEPVVAEYVEQLRQARDRVLRNVAERS